MKLLNFGLILLSCLFCGCTNEVASQTALTSALNGIMTRLRSVAMLKSGQREGVWHRTAPLDFWTSPNQLFSLSGSGYSSALEWMGDGQNPDFVDGSAERASLFGRYLDMAGTLCSLGIGVAQRDSSGLPAEGTHFVQVTDAMISACDLVGGSGQTLVAVVTEPFYDNIYSKRIEVDLGNSEPYVVYIGKFGNLTNLAILKDHRPFSQARSRVFVVFDESAHVLRLEYTSQYYGSGTYEFDRVYLNEALDLAFVVGHVGAFDNSSYVQYTISGKPQTPTHNVAVSMKYAGQNGADDYGVGCVNATTGALEASNTLNCDVTGTDIDVASVIETNRTSKSTLTDYTIGELMQIGFSTSTNMLVNQTP